MIYDTSRDIIKLCKGKGGFLMGTEAERQDTRKAMAFDLCNIIDEDPSQETYTKEEIKKIIRVYLTTAEQTN